MSVIIPVNQTDDDTAELLIYGVIGEDFFEEGITAKAMKTALDELPDAVQTVNLRVNSPGGFVYEALAIHNLLARDHRRIEVDVDGLAASAASFVIQAAAEIRAAEKALLMVHRAQGITLGDAPEHAKMAEILEKHDQSIASIYAKRTGRRASTWLKYMGEETWFTASEAKEARLVDEVTEAGEATACADRRIAARWQKMPEAAERYVIDARRLEEERVARARRVAARMREIETLEAAQPGGRLKILS